MNHEEEVAEILVILLMRAGGKLTFSDEEREAAKGATLVYDADPDKAGFTHLTLIPDYVALEEPERPADPAWMEWPAAVPSSVPTYWDSNTNNAPYVAPVGTSVYNGSNAVGTVTNSNLTPNGFEMKLSEQGKRYAQKWADLQKGPYSIGWDPATGKIKKVKR